MVTEKVPVPRKRSIALSWLGLHHVRGFHIEGSFAVNIYIDLARRKERYVERFKNSVVNPLKVEYFRFVYVLCNLPKIPH